ncbi:FYVE, RhoGEF and PH domain-containing protein 6 [Rhinophrynus dorsalis]
MTDSHLQPARRRPSPEVAKSIIYFSSADIKKPPVAPKPKLTLGQKPSPPPVAPKPDLVLPSVIQSSKKAKPTIAPKPKVLLGSSVPEEKPQCNTKLNVKSIVEQKDNCSESSKCRKETSEANDSSNYIIPTCSCNCDCSHKLGNGDFLPKTQKVIERLENLENKKMCGQPAPCVRTRKKQCNQQAKLAKANQVIFKAGILEDKVKDVISQNVFVNGHSYKWENSDKTFKKVTCSPSKDKSKELKGFEGSICTSDGSSYTLNNHSNLEVDDFPLPQGGSTFHPDSENIKQTNGISLLDKSSITEDDKESGPPTRALPPQKVLPVPKPRKLRIPGLVRQDCIERNTECNSEPVSLNVNSQELLDCGINGVDHSTTHRGLTNKYGIPSIIDSNTQNTISRRQDESITIENVEISVNSDLSINPSEISDHSSTHVEEVKDNFVRCSSLSMSLPKQLKLIYEQQLDARKSIDVATEKKSDHNKQATNSPRVAPKKPQRHSLPAAGLLKKAVSEERLNDSSNKEVLTGTAGCKGTSRSNFLIDNDSCSIPKQTPEKPEWKLPHPILPFLGNPESLKASSIKDTGSPVTKPRAKSLSSVDMERIEKSTKESPKKSPLRKFLNMKLSVCLIKSDFQRFLSRGCQSLDTTTHDEPSFIESSASPALDKKVKPAKAHSADSSSPSPKKRQRHRSEGNAVNNDAALSLDKDLFPKQMTQVSSFDLSHCDLPDYENVRHYEEIPEYENLPFTLVSDQSECDTTIYEVEYPNESMNCTVHKHVYHSEPSQEDPDDDVLDIVHSDEEEIINSSDEDDVSSDSSKAELDHMEYKQKKVVGKKTKVYHIAKEIMSSEKVFVDVLKLLHIDFRYAVAQASRHLGKSVIEDKILNQILYYLPQLYELNRDVLRELEERMSQWNEHQKIADIFLKKGPYLKMYSTYIREFDRNVTLLDEQCKKNPAFAGVVKDFEMSPRCANLALKHYLLKPVQRIPQYRLLLTDYLKNLQEESSDYSDTQAALSVVIEVANHANDILKQGDNFQKLMQIQYSLNGHHEIVQPGRVFLKEGTLMKLSRKVMQPRMFFLFNDALLYTTPVQSGMYKLNNMLSLAGMKVRKPTQEAYQNELKIESVERSFILSASSATERDDWLEAISGAIEEYAKKKITFNPTKSLEESDPEEKGDSSLGSKAPIWIPDGRATMCMICTSEFTLTWRRHHCRACGKIICQACSTNKHSLEYLKNHLARVCDRCFQELQRQDTQSSPKPGTPANHKSPTSALSTVLHSIPSGRKQKKIPAALKVSASTEDSSMSGYLQRSKGSKKQWKQLWFVIKNKVLYTYAASEDIAALESQPLLGFTIKEVKDDPSESTVIHLLHKNTIFYIFKADDAHTTQRWIEAFQGGTVL